MGWWVEVVCVKDLYTGYCVATLVGSLCGLGLHEHNLLLDISFEVRARFSKLIHWILILIRDAGWPTSSSYKAAECLKLVVACFRWTFPSQ
jgi:hypothetical protein